MRINNFFAVSIVGLLSTAVVAPVFADEGNPLLDRDKFSVGGGLSFNSVSGPLDNNLGFQAFGSYDLSMINLMDGVHSSAEIGVMDYGIAKTNTGFWTTFVVDGRINYQFGWLARLGADFGGDNGLMAGGGASFSFDEKIDFRLEYVVRNNVKSLQFNVNYQL